MSADDTPTPRTDAELNRIAINVNAKLYSESEGFDQARRFARQLERELTAAKEENAATKELLSATQTECLARANDLNHGADREIALEDTIALLRKRVEAADKIAEAVDKMNEGDWDVEKAVEAYRATEGKK